MEGKRCGDVSRTITMAFRRRRLCVRCRDGSAEDGRTIRISVRSGPVDQQIVSNRSPSMIANCACAECRSP